MGDLGEIEGCNSEIFESLGCATNGMAMLGSRKWPGPAGVAVDRTGNTFLGLF